MTVAGQSWRAVSVAIVTLSALQAGAVAEPQPTAAQARAKLVKLNERADGLVEKFNQATEAYKKSKKRHDTLRTDLERKRARIDDLRDNLVAMAIAGYQSGGPASWQANLVAGDFKRTLNRAVTINQMAESQVNAQRVFDAATRELQVQLDTAKAVLADADAARDKVQAEKKKVDKLVLEQTRLLRRLGAFNPGNPGSAGVVYTGSASGDARVILQFAFKQIGKPYRYGGTGPDSYDCSGFAQASWRAAGVSLPRTTYEQWSWGAERRVSLNDLQPGDLLFSKGLGHMGIYAGDGKMIHAPQTGDVVKVVDIDGYWRGRFLGAVRP
ncbi:C40 family peptidase [Acrocarpospora catenulata]|uniref:C40 family peptidase n=1 Tax=Acrocarpospora catenulata TaxID=2836182 RepID=UPI0027E14708|nr:NlpC/P60 family protein [Acrocarpospora catenulata]